MIDQDEKLTVTLTAAQWRSLNAKINDDAFQATVSINNQLMQQQIQLEQRQVAQERPPARRGRKPKLREVANPEFHIPDVAE